LERTAVSALKVEGSLFCVVDGRSRFLISVMVLAKFEAVNFVFRWHS